jgi:hypothetical protein
MEGSVIRTTTLTRRVRLDERMSVEEGRYGVTRRLFPDTGREFSGYLLAIESNKTH